MKYGAQLYTVRDFMQTHKDFAGSVRKISKLGFDCVQVAGISPIIPVEEIAETCKAHELEIVLSHTDADALLNNTKEVIQNHKLMEAKFVGLERIPKTYERGRTGFVKFCLDFTPIARELKNEGLQLVYHNHHMEFEQFEGKNALEYIREHLWDADFTLDIYWAHMAGADPAHWIRRLNKRIKVLHLKDCAVVEGISRMSEVMEGNMNWPRIMNAAKEVEIEYAMIEQEECFGKDPFECLGASLYNLRNKLSEKEDDFELPQVDFKPQYIDRKLSSSKDELVW
jgi:sugar phosphate isomerase/epimerase